jgi:hypothetical protein
MNQKETEGVHILNTNLCIVCIHTENKTTQRIFFCDSFEDRGKTPPSTDHNVETHIKYFGRVIHTTEIRFTHMVAGIRLARKSTTKWKTCTVLAARPNRSSMYLNFLIYYTMDLSATTVHYNRTHAAMVLSIIVIDYLLANHQCQLSANSPVPSGRGITPDHY